MLETTLDINDLNEEITDLRNKMGLDEFFVTEDDPLFSLCVNLMTDENSPPNMMRTMDGINGTAMGLEIIVIHYPTWKKYFWAHTIK